MAGKKKSPTKKTAQEIREMVACLEEATEYLDEAHEWFDLKTIYELGAWRARVDKLIGNPK